MTHREVLGKTLLNLGIHQKLDLEKEYENLKNDI